MIPLDFASSKVVFEWPDIRWGYERKLLSWEDVKKFAERNSHGSRKEEISSIALVDKNSAHDLENSLRCISMPSFYDKRKWLYVCISWIYANRNLSKDPLGEIEMVYADFDYPDEIASFIRFMPPNDGYDPSAHTQEQNLARIENKWAAYVSQGYFE